MNTNKSQNIWLKLFKSSKTNTSLDLLSLTCLFTLKDDNTSDPVNCHGSLALMKVQFLLKDAWSSDCCIDNSLQILFSFPWSSEEGERGQLRKTGLWMPALLLTASSGVKQPSGLWKKWIIILLGDKAEDDTPPTDGQLVRQVREQAWETALPRSPTAEGRARNFYKWREPLNAEIASIRNSNSQVMTIERQKHIWNKGNKNCKTADMKWFLFSKAP